MVFSQSTPVLNVLHVMFLKLKENRGWHVETWLYPHSLFIVAFLSFVEMIFLLWTIWFDFLILYWDEQFIQNQIENEGKVFSKNITCKTSRTGVDLENTNVFNFYVTIKLLKTYAWMRCQKKYERPKNILKKTKLRNI